MADDLDLGRWRVIKGRAPKARPLPVAERLRAARRIPQAIVKVYGYCHGMGSVQRHLEYISRDGKLPLETETGELIKGLDAQRDLLRNWVVDFDDHPRSRDTVKLVFSAPHGSNAKALRRAVRALLQKRFHDYEYAFSLHQDQKHFHAHVMVKMRAIESEKKLRLDKPDLYELRELFAEHGRAEGIQMTATSRAARGVGRKGEAQAVVHLRERGEVPHADRALAQELKSGKKRERPWEEAIAKRHQLEKMFYRNDAQSLRKMAEDLKGEARAKLIKAAEELEDFAKKLPPPQTRRQTLVEKAREKKGRPPTSPDHPRDDQEPQR